jgi:hypothetical protein
MQFILNMDMYTGIKLIQKAFEQQTEDKIFQMWLSHSQNAEKPMSLQEYKQQVLKPDVKEIKPRTQQERKEFDKKIESIIKKDRENLNKLK